VHRNQLSDAQGTPRWLTLPLEKAPQDVLIRDLRFAADAAEIFKQRLRPFHLASDDSAVQSIIATVENLSGTPVDYIERTLEQIAGYLGLRWNVVRSSALSVPPEIRGAARILEIVSRLGGTRYINAPGGRDLYDVEVFASSGIELRFLTSYSGPPVSILSRILHEPREELSSDIIQSTTYLDSRRDESGQRSSAAV
jgi:hypothetical protein